MATMPRNLSIDALIEGLLPETQEEIRTKADEINAQRAVARKKDDADWLGRIRNQFIPTLDEAEAAVLRKYIKIVEKHGGTLLIQNDESAPTVSVTWRNKKFEVALK